MLPCISPNPIVQSAYERMRQMGQSHNIAEMCALAAPPQLGKTDRAFLQGHANGNQFESQPEIGDLYAAEARAAGVDPKGKVYLGQLANYPGDPEAWVADRSDVRRVCESRGWGCSGSVSVARVDTDDDPPPPISLADDIVDDKVAEILDHVPQTERPRIDVTNLKEQVKDKMTPPWNKE